MTWSKTPLASGQKVRHCRHLVLLCFIIFGSVGISPTDTCCLLKHAKQRRCRAEVVCVLQNWHNCCNSFCMCEARRLFFFLLRSQLISDWFCFHCCCRFTQPAFATRAWTRPGCHPSERESFGGVLRSQFSLVVSQNSVSVFWNFFQAPYRSVLSQCVFQLLSVAHTA